jgi:hypothetical protein
MKPDDKPTNWPFPVVNSERTSESKALLEQKFKPTKHDLSDIEEGLF